MKYAEAITDKRYLAVNVNGNRKLQNTANVRWIIWNLPAVTTCPFATAHCRESCYARKAERFYPQTLPARERNYQATLEPDFSEKMIFTLETEITSRKNSGKLTIVRIHESGDFYSTEYVEKWLKVCRHFADNLNVVFLAYTKSIPYVIACGYGTSQWPKNIVVRSSLWDDTKFEMRYDTASYDIPVYTALTGAEMLDERKKGHLFFECKCEDCAKCRACINPAVKDIIVKIH